MNATTRLHDELFDGGPPIRWERAAGLIKSSKLRMIRQIELVLLIGWAPMCVLAIVQSAVFKDHTAKLFLTDFSCYQRFLVAVPFFVLAESDCIPRLGIIAHHFAASGLITDFDRDRYDSALASTRRLLDHLVVEILTVVLAYATGLALLYFVPANGGPSWYRAESGLFNLTLPALWMALISLPLMLVLILGWLWRIALWVRFLWLMQRLDLHLVPGHPDCVGGLQFVNTSMRGFRFLAFAFGNIVAGTVANGVRDGASPFDSKYLVIGLIVFVLFMSAGPLTIFLRSLRRAKRQAVFSYGRLAARVGRQFEQKWLKPGEPLDLTVLEVPDFSATVDLFGVVANVYQMKDILFRWQDLVPLVLAAMLPFIPIALLLFPFEVLLKDITKLLL